MVDIKPRTYQHGRLFACDAAAVAASMDCASVRLVYCDGPYGLGFGEWDKAQGRDLVEWYAPHFDAFDRVCMGSASLAVWGSTRSWAYLHADLEARGWSQCGQVIWDKGNATTTMRADPDTLRSWPQTHEIAGLYRRDGLEAPNVTHSAGADERNWIREWIRAEWSGAGLTQAQANTACGTQMAGHYFGRSQWCLPTFEHFQALAEYAAQNGREPPSERNGRPWLVHADCVDERATFEHLRAEFEHLRAPFNLKRTLPSVWREPSPTTQGGRHGHPCEKPPGLTRLLIETLTNPGDLVFEPFGGSCPVARLLESMPTGTARRWVSCETDAKHVARTIEMLDSTQLALL